MPAYDFKCRDCGYIQEVFCHHEDLEKTLDCYTCQACGSRDCFNKISIGLTFVRDDFPKGYWEHLGPEPTHVRDRGELRDICEKRGLRSRLIEDGR